MATKVTISAAKAAERYVSGLSNSIDKIRAGVEAVTVAPGEKAALSADKWIANLQKAHTSGKWKNRVKGVTLEQWRSKMIDLGLNRIASGANAAKVKMTTFYDRFLPHLENGLEKISSMPKNTLDDSINRMVAMVRHNATFVM